MILESERTIALLCPACQQIQKRKFSLFSISRQSVHLLCRCGFSLGHLRGVGENIEIDILDIDGERVYFTLRRNKLVKSNLINMSSPEKGNELGYLGTSEIIKEYVSKKAFQFEPTTGDFSDPIIMNNVLNILQELAKRHKIGCECEQPSIGIDVYPKQVELVCSSCNGMVRISANTQKDLDRLSQIEEIVIKPCFPQIKERWLKPLP